MYRQIVWCYIIVLTLLDISLNTKLSAQGKNHGNGVSVHESLMEGISLQEWGKDSGEGSGSGEAGGRGRAAPGDALALWPPALQFGAAALATAHARAVTITNTANETVHLASVAGTTPDFHASFFEAKTLAPQANTSFSVVYLGRREGPVSAYLYIHTSKGVHKYPVSAVGVASEWRVWPLVGVRVPLNSTVEPLLTLYNPTDTPIQVTEVYSSGAWVGLALPGGGGSAPRDAWALPPHAARDIVALRLRPPPDPAAPPLTAYIRIKGNMTGGGLVVCVEAGGAPAGKYLSPLQVRLAVRGSGDPLEQLWVEAGNSGAASLELAGGAGAAQCSATRAPPAPAPDAHNGGGGAPGVHLAVLRDRLPPHQPLVRAARLTFDYEKMWAGVESGATAAWCGGWVRVGRAALPYSLRLLRGTLVLRPDTLHFVTSNDADMTRRKDVVARNEFAEPVRVTRVDFPPDVRQHFETESLTPLVIGAGGAATVATLRARPSAAAQQLRAELTLRTNITDYTLPLLLYRGDFTVEWEWPAWSASELDVGAVGAGSWRRVEARLVNAGPAPLCVTRLRAALAGGGARLRLRACALEPGDMPPHLAPADDCRCVGAGGALPAALSVGAGPAAGAAHGHVEVRSPHAATRVALRLTAHAGRVAAAPLALPPAAPYVWAEAPLVLDNTTPLRMRVTNVTQPPDEYDPALTFTVDASVEVGAGRAVVGGAVYAAEAHCAGAGACYTGLALERGEGAAWAARGGAALARDAALQRARHAAVPRAPRPLAAHVRTTRALRVEARGAVREAWPALAPRRPLRAPLAALHAHSHARLLARNPSSSHAVVLQPLLHDTLHDLGGSEADSCPECVWSRDAWALGGWRATRGSVREWSAPPAPGAAPRAAPGAAAPAPGTYLALGPHAELELTLVFTPHDAADLAAYLYLRNNLTILERVLLTGRGAHPSFELAGRKPNSTSPILIEVSECGSEGGAGAGARTVTLRNTGAVPLRLRNWRVAGAACGARGFRLQPCAALALQPNESRALTLAFAADWTRARAHAALTVRAGARLAAFPLAAAAPARLLARCAPHARRPPFEPALRALGAAAALLALVGCAALAALDAERALRRHRAARAPAAAARAPLDLRALALGPAAAPAPEPRRRRTPRRRAAPLDARAERRAFERWRAEAERRARDDDSRSSAGEEDRPPPPRPDSSSSSSSPDSSPPPRESYEGSPRRSADDEEGVSTGSDSSSAGEQRRASPAAAPPTPPARASPSEVGARPASPRAPRPAARAPRPDPRAATRPAARRAARRRERAPSPPRAAPRHEPRAPPAVRWGASWSSVVSRGPAAAEPAPAPPRPAPPLPPPPPPPAAAEGAPPPLAPIGSDLRRRLGSHSLFFYNAGGEAGAWAPPAEAVPPPPPRAADEGAGYRSLEALWGAGAEPAPAWLWGGAGGAVRPPPGFAPARAVRSYDPFHSLASIWTPAALDWRLDGTPPPPPDDKTDAAPSN